MPWVNGGIMYSIGRGCNGVSYAFFQCGYNRGFTLAGGCMQNSFCRFGKISLGFCNQTFLQYGCKRVFIIQGCMLGSFCRFGKISLGFCNQTFLQYGCKRVFISFRDVCWAPPADLGKSRWGLAIMHPYQFGVKWGSMTGLHRLS